MSLYFCDTNVWLALTLPSHVHHRSARVWFETVDEPESISFCRSTQQSFLRLLTSRAMLAPFGSPPLTNREAWAAFEVLLADYRVVLETQEPVGLEAYWREYSLRTTASPGLWMDAYLAAFARAAGHQMITTDNGFRQFQGLDLIVLGNTGRR